MKLKDIISKLKSTKCKSVTVENKLILLTGDWTSYRGTYDYPALEYKAWKYGDELKKVEQLLNVLEYMIGETMIGWKGGEFIVDEDKEVFVSNEGCYTGMCISELEEIDDYCINIKLKEWAYNDEDN